MVTLYDVANRAGVSIATVSRVLHGQQPVRESTRTRVRAAIEELGYVPDGAAQSLARSRKEVIGLVCVDHAKFGVFQYDAESMSLTFYDEVLRGVEGRISDLSWSLLITFLREHGNGHVTALADEPVQSRLLAFSGKVDGLLLGEGPVPAPFVARLAKRLPVVVVAGDTALRGVDVVSADNWSGAYALVSHLVEDHGMRRFIHVGGPATAPDAQTRRAATQAVIDVHPEAKLIASYSGLFSVSSGEDAAARMLADFGRDLPDAVVAANDQMAIGVLRTLTEHGVRVPEDVAVVGFDDIFTGGVTDNPLTTVHQPVRKMGERACGRLLERIADPTLRPEVELLATQLVLRSSCGCPSGTVTRRPVPHVSPSSCFSSAAAQTSKPRSRPGKRKSR